MRIPTPIQALSAAAALALLAGCSSGSAIAPSVSKAQGHSVHTFGRVPTVLNPVGMLRLQNLGAAPSHKVQPNNCPASGTIAYMSDFALSEIAVYKGGNTTALVQCNVLSGPFINPQGMIVKGGKVWVANTGAGTTVELNRNSTTIVKTYTDPTCSGQFPVDVTVSGDDYVYVSNIFGGACAGSISVFKKGGAYVTTIPNPNGANTYFLTIQKNNDLYFDDNTFGMYKMHCVLGSCGSATNTGAVMNFPGGIRSGLADRVVLDDQSGPGGGNLYTYVPPTFTPNNTNCGVGGSDPVSFDLNFSRHHAFFADAGLNQLTELTYNSTTGACGPKWTAPGLSSGEPIGAAVDRAESLQ